MPVVRKLACRVRSVVDHGEHVYTVDLVPTGPIPAFRPGQFLHLALDPYEPGAFWPESRVFSIASSPEDRDRLSITYAVKGPFTHRMERELEPRRTVWVKLPYGEFMVEPDRDAVLFAGGTGITAFTAFLGSLEPADTRRVLLIYGARTPDLFVYENLARARAREVPSLTATLVCQATEGRLRADMAWPAAANLEDPAFYISGPPQMLRALTDQLLANLVTPANIRTDAWE